MSFENTDFRQVEIDIENPYDVKMIRKFLKKGGFDYKKNEIDATMILYNLKDDIIGTGSHQEKTLKYVFVAPEFRDSSAFAQIVNYFTDKLLQKYKRVFVFTKPETAKLFESLGFSIIATAKPLFSVLEFGYETIKDYQIYLFNKKKRSKTRDIAGIVVNCNPFTNGHKYLIEKASSENELVYLFVVETNKSMFPFDLRWKLIEEGIAELNNVVMLKTGPYIVSGAIFPNYFLKNESFNLISQKQAEIDVKIFAKYIAPILGINKRYIGTENYCHTTAAYNKAMHEILPDAGVEVIEITRIALGMDKNNEPEYISASKVRAAIKQNKLNEIIDFIPEVTRKYLSSPEAEEITNKIKSSDSRH